MTDFLDDVSINKYKLDEELVKQPQKYYEWATAEARAQERVENLKHDLDVIKSKVEIRIRNHPTLYDLPDNPKEALVKATVTIQPKVKRGHKKLLRAQKIHRLLIKSEKAFEQRKKSLEGLVSLNMQIHFATPRNVQRKDLEIEGQQSTLLDKARNNRRKIKRR